MQSWKVWTFVKLFIFLSSCSFNEEAKESYLIIGIEKLPYTSELCASYNLSETEAGFKEVCEDFIRFTHMITPSTQSQAVIASIFTGLHPMEHNVWHNGNVHLKESYQTVAEDFFSKGWETSFYSGGGSIWRKSGFSQGFGVFDDNIPIHVNNYYRPVEHTFSLFSNWVDSLDKKDFFSFIYLPDLLFPSVPTKDTAGMSRESSYLGQKKTLSENLSTLFLKMKKSKVWDKTNVIILGLNGNSSDLHPKEKNAYNLLSENTQVAYFYKPASKKRDTSLSWKVDRYYSLVDLGFSLKKKVSVMNKDSLLVKEDILSKQLLKNRTNEEKWILSESAWPQWRKKSTVRYSLRKGNIYYVFDSKIKKYNSLIDRLDVNPQIFDWESMPDEELAPLVDRLKIEKWVELPEQEVEKINLGNKLWNPKEIEISEEDFFDIYKYTEDIQILEWLASLSVDKKKWELLEKISNFSKNDVWNFIARYNLSTLEKTDWEKLSDGCLLLFLKEEKISKGLRVSEQQECKNKEVSLFYDWINSSEEEKERRREKLISALIEKRIFENIYKLNYLADLSWDISLRYPKGPSLLDLILSFSKYKVYNSFIKRRMEMVQNDKVVY